MSCLNYQILMAPPESRRVVAEYITHFQLPTIIAISSSTSRQIIGLLWYAWFKTAKNQYFTLSILLICPLAKELSAQGAEYNNSINYQRMMICVKRNQLIKFQFISVATVSKASNISGYAIKRTVVYRPIMMEIRNLTPTHAIGHLVKTIWIYKKIDCAMLFLAWSRQKLKIGIGLCNVSIPVLKASIGAILVNFEFACLIQR